MSDEPQAPTGDQNPAPDFDAKLAEAVEKATAGLKAKNAELLSETKAEREKRQALEKAQEEAEAERQQKDGEHQKLWETEREKRQRLEQELSDYRAKVQRKEVEAATSAVAHQLTRDTGRAAILAEQAAKFAKPGEDGIQYEIGGVKVEQAQVLDHLRTQYPFLVDGSQASGGGATGGSGGAAKKLSEMGDAERLALAREGKLKAATGQS